MQYRNISNESLTTPLPTGGNVTTEPEGIVLMSPTAAAFYVEQGRLELVPPEQPAAKAKAKATPTKTTQPATPEESN